MKTLKPAHERFLQAMMQCHSQKEAYLAAYPNSSPAAAKANASRLLKREPEIRRRLKERHEAILAEDRAREWAFLQQQYEMYCAQQAVYAGIIAGGPVVKQLPNGKIIKVPSTLNDRLSAVSKYHRLEQQFLAKYPMFFKALNPDAAVDTGDEVATTRVIKTIRAEMDKALAGKGLGGRS